MNISPPLLAVFLKYPTPGAVKTRLARRLGAAQAARLYDNWIQRIFEQLQPMRPHVQVVAWYDGAPLDDFARWFHLADVWRLQPPGGLGVRLAAAFHRRNASRGGNATSQKIVAIGTDCLEIDSQLVANAFGLLERFDAVLGPTPDGGYYLIGTSKPADNLFENIRWSTAETRQDQLVQCRRLGLSVGMLPLRRDIDTWEDWCEYQKKHGSNPCPTPPL